jgi:hypothetical protein
MNTVKISVQLFRDLRDAEEAVERAKQAIVNEASLQLGRDDVEYDDENVLVVGDGFENEYPDWEIV